MTTKEIAEATGKDVSTVQRWIKKMNGKMQSIDGKMQSSNSTNPADFDLTETIAIIENGMGKNAAALYRMSAAKQPLQNDKVLPQNAEVVTRSDLAEFGRSIVSETIKQLLPLIQGATIQPVRSQSIATEVSALPPIDPRKELNMLAREAGYAMGDYGEPYNQIYKNAYYSLGVNLRERAKNRGVGVLDYAESEGYMTQLVAIARELFK
jgi:hypothetical protein